MATSNNNNEEDSDRPNPFYQNVSLGLLVGTAVQSEPIDLTVGLAASNMFDVTTRCRPGPILNEQFSVIDLSTKNHDNEERKNYGELGKKHKLSYAPANDDSPIKISKIMDASQQKPKSRPVVLLDIKPKCTASITAKNHTITSRDMDTSPSSSRTTVHVNSIDGSVNLIHQDFINNRSTKVSSLGLQEKDISDGTVESKNLSLLQNELHAELHPQPKALVGLPPAVHHLLDMFPDINVDFLNDCSQGLNIIELTEFILEMNGNYPKAIKLHVQQQIQPPFNIHSSSTVLTRPNGQNQPNFYVEPQLYEVYPQVPIVPANMINSVPSIPSVPTVNLINDKPNGSLLVLSECVLRPINPDLNTEAPVTAAIEKRIGLPYNESHTDTVIHRPSVNHNREVQSQLSLDFLKEIFPDADPNFLFEKSNLAEYDMRLFISNALTKKDYPKLVRPKPPLDGDSDLNDLGLYTSAFNIEHFLKIFPDPFKYFFDVNRISTYTDHAYEFIKRRYRNHSVIIIRQKYIGEFKYNLSRTCEYLDTLKSTRSTKRCLQEIHMPDAVNLPFLQEACFVEHRAEIKAHLEIKENVRNVAYEQARVKGELITCGCCYDECMFEDCAACNDGDLFCKCCIQKSVEVRIGDGMTTFPCLLDCGAHFSLHLLQNLLEARIFSSLLKRIQLDEVKAADIEGLEICPFCEFATIPPENSNIFTCLNPDCLKESCRKCHKTNHIPLRCEEVESDDQAKARKFIEDEMTRALVRECHKCKKSFIKTDGCNKMTCTCGARMCYLCRAPVIDYTHFNGPGGSNVHKCPLYSTDKELHTDAVQAVAIKALETVTVNNPGLTLKYDPTKVSQGKASMKKKKMGKD